MQPCELSYRDLTEARAAVQGDGSTRTPRSASKSAIGWVLFISLAIMLIVLIRKDHPNATNPLAESLSVPARVAFALLGIGLALSAMVWFGVFRYIFRRHARYSVTIQFDEQGITWDRAEVSSTWQWSAFAGIRETSNLIVLFTPAGMLQMVPRRAFENKGEELSFLQYASEGVAVPVARRADAN